AAVMVALAEAIRALPASTVGPVADDLLKEHPNDLLAAMTALDTRLRIGSYDGVADIAKTIASLTSPDSAHAVYAESVGWLLRNQQEPNAVSQTGKTEISAIRKRLAGVEQQRRGWTDLLCLLARIDLLERKTKQAIGHYQQALATRPSDPGIVMAIAAIFVGLGQYADAEKTLDGLDSVTLLQLGRLTAELRLRSGKIKEAVAIASRAAESVAVDPDDLLWFASVIADHDTPSAAAAAIQRGIAHVPPRTDLWLALADYQATAGDHAAAAATLEDALTHGPEEGRALIRAEIERRARRMDGAVAAFRALLEEPMPGPLCLHRAAECFLEAGLATDSQAALERMLTIPPATKADQEAIRWARRRLSEELLRERSFPVSQKSLQDLKDGSVGKDAYTPDDADFAAVLLAGRPEPKSWRTALELLESLGRQQTLTATQVALASRLRGRLGDSRRAREDLLSLAVKPNMPAEVYATFVDLLLTSEDPKSAATWLGKLVTLAPTAPETIALQARVALAQGDTKAAVAAAKRLMPVGDVTAESSASVLAAAGPMEQLGFMPAAENLLARAAETTDAAALARVGFLVRRSRIEEASESLDSLRDRLATDRRFALLEAAVCEKRDRPQDAEPIYRRMLEGTEAGFAERVQAAARLALCLVDRGAAEDAVALADRAVLDLGPHPDLLDARGVASIATGYVAGAVRDLSEAVLAPTPERLLHLAHAKAAAGDASEARAPLQRARAAGLDPEPLRPSDRQRLDQLVKTLGTDR
ncbi:MAG: tetratricopeptide repeat protein, partial [Planctomycetia bacterium]